MTDVFGKGLYLKTVGNLARLLLVVNRQDIKNDEFILSTFPCTISSLANDHTLVNIRLGLRAGVDARCAAIGTQQMPLEAVIQLSPRSFVSALNLLSTSDAVRLCHGFILVLLRSLIPPLAWNPLHLTICAQTCLQMPMSPLTSAPSAIWQLFSHVGAFVCYCFAYRCKLELGSCLSVKCDFAVVTGTGNPKRMLLHI